MKIGRKRVGIDGKGYANTTYISEFHPHITAGRIFQKKGLSGGGGRLGRRRPAALFFEKSGRLGCGDGIRRCRLCSHILCHQFQPIFSPFSIKSYWSKQPPSKRIFPPWIAGGNQRATSCLQLMSNTHIKHYRLKVGSLYFW